MLAVSCDTAMSERSQGRCRFRIEELMRTTPVCLRRTPNPKAGLLEPSGAECPLNRARATRLPAGIRGKVRGKVSAAL